MHHLSYDVLHDDRGLSMRNPTTLGQRNAEPGALYLASPPARLQPTPSPQMRNDTNDNSSAFISGVSSLTHIAMTRAPTNSLFPIAR